MKRFVQKSRVCRERGECAGGGRLQCYQRDPKPSVLAGIIDSYGGIRYVVTQSESLKHHVRCDELLIVVPDLIVHEPIAWNDIPIVIERVNLWVEEWLRGRPNLDDVGYNAIKMYRIRQLHNPNRTIDLHEIVET